MTEKPQLFEDEFENNLELSFWDFKDKCSKNGGMERDYFKQSIRKYFQEKPMADKINTVRDLITKKIAEKDIDVFNLFYKDPFFYKFYCVLCHNETPEVILDFIVELCKDRSEIEKRCIHLLHKIAGEGCMVWQR